MSDPDLTAAIAAAVAHALELDIPERGSDQPMAWESTPPTGYPDLIAAALAPMIQQREADTLEQLAHGLGWLGAQGNVPMPDRTWSGVSACIKIIREQAATIRPTPPGGTGRNEPRLSNMQETYLKDGSAS